MPVEWVTVVLPGTDAPPARVNRKHYEEVLKAKGFVLESTARWQETKKSMKKEKE
jgi:hypothetical protein